MLDGGCKLKEIPEETDAPQILVVVPIRKNTAEELKEILKNGVHHSKLIQTILKRRPETKEDLHPEQLNGKNIMFFSPDMTEDISNYVARYKSCQTNQRDNVKETILLQEIPERPWQQVSSNIFPLNVD